MVAPGRGQVYALSLEVTVTGQEQFRAEVTSTIPYDRVPRVGQVLPVTVSASDSARVTVDWKRAPSITDMAQAASAAALAGDSAGAAAALGFAVRPEPDGSEDDKGTASAEPG